ncbi:hypothetical protein [Actinobacillus suis]|uniref:PFGI-1 class ICE element type IV pilus protein PilL2 n=1 Tax=Actinobacillus suis TaxID=716 RepID=UPI000E316FC1|nr:hypothetical protein [Actinobacillus suis]
MKTSTLLLSILSAFIVTGCAKQTNSSNQNNSSPNDVIAPGIPIPENQLAVDVNSSSPTSLNPNPAPIEVARTVSENIYTSNFEQYPEVVRYGRYTLVSSSPVGGQKYLLEQVVNIDMIGKKKKVYYNLTVEQGIWNTLKDTGYTLCSISSPEVRSLFNHQLPKVHYQFGPMKLRDALQMLAGEAYELTVHDTLRQICYERRASIPKPIEPKVQIEAIVPEDY